MSQLRICEIDTIDILLPTGEAGCTKELAMNRLMKVIVASLLVILLFSACSITRYDISSPGVRELINKYGTYDRNLTEEDKYLSAEECKDIFVDSYIDGKRVGTIALNEYLDTIIDESYQISDRLTGSFGGIGLLEDTTVTDLEREIIDIITSFDTNNGGAMVHKPMKQYNSPNLREIWIKYIIEEIDSRGNKEKRNLQYNISFENTLRSLVAQYGYIPNSDDDYDSDIIDYDDDNDGISDTKDDDDDNDGCLDRDEKDGNIGGETGDLTGQGRGNRIGNAGEKVEPDDPNFDPGDTSRFDNE